MFEDFSANEDFFDTRKKCQTCREKATLSWDHYRWHCKKCVAKKMWVLE